MSVGHNIAARASARFSTSGTSQRLLSRISGPHYGGLDSMPLTPNEIEAANPAEPTALLIRAGYRVYRPEADCYGEDLILREPCGQLRVTQLKSCPTVNRLKYGGKDIWMLFPDTNIPTASGRKWFLVPHDLFYAWIENR